MQKQTRMGRPWGNCLEACYAVLLGADVEDIPDLRVDEALAQGRGEDELAEAMLAKRPAYLRRLLRAAGYRVLQGPGYPPSRALARSITPGWWIGHGPADRGHHHAVLYRGRAPHPRACAWDPYPGGNGLQQVASWTVVLPPAG